MDKISKILEKRHRAQQSFYINIPFVIIGELLAEKLKNTSITANMVSISSLFFSFIFAIVIYFWTFSYSWVGIPFVLLVGIAFTVDGSLARKNNKSSIFGAWLNTKSEYLSYTILGISFVYYAYIINDNSQTILFLALLSYIFRQAIYIIYPFAEAKVPNVNENIFSKELEIETESLLTKLKRAFTYSGYMYLLMITLGIILEAHLYFVFFMALYGSVSFVAGLIVVGKNIREYEKGNSN